MDQELRKAIPQHMRDMATGVLAMANYTAHIYNSVGFGKWPEFSVLHAAHAVELLVKARIAEEHPMLIFKHPPKKLSSPQRTPTASPCELKTNGMGQDRVF
jgi:hypothetical protein